MSILITLICVNPSFADKLNITRNGEDKAGFIRFYFQYDGLGSPSTIVESKSHGFGSAGEWSTVTDKLRKKLDF